MSEGTKSSGAVVLQGAFGCLTAALVALITAVVVGGVSGYISARLVSQELRSQSCNSALELIVENDPTGELIGNDTLEAFDLIEAQARLNCSPEVLAVLDELKEKVQDNPELRDAISRGEVDVELRTDPATGRQGIFLVPRGGFQPSPTFPDLEEPILVVP
jgi:predicted RND superfamily exporter protein